MKATPLEPTDEHYMEQAASGDVNAFGILFERHQAHLVAFLTRFVGNRAVAEDLAQEAFWNVWKTRAAFNPRQSFRVFLYVVAKNLALNEQTSARHRRTVSLSADWEPESRVEKTGSDFSADPLGATLQSELKSAVRAALADLPADQRLCVLLHEYDGYSYQEIGRILGCSTVAARVLGFRARNRLKRLLAPHLPGENECDALTNQTINQ